MNESIRNFYVEIGSDPKQNALIKKNISEALQLALAKLNSGWCNRDGDLDDVLELIEVSLRFIGLIVPALTTVLGSAVDGLLKGLSTELRGNGLIAGLLGGVGGALHGLTTGALKGLSNYLKSYLP